MISVDSLDFRNYSYFQFPDPALIAITDHEINPFLALKNSWTNLHFQADSLDDALHKVKNMMVRTIAFMNSTQNKTFW